MPTTVSSPLENIHSQTRSLWTEEIYSDRFGDLGKKYRDKPTGFVQDCIIWGKDHDERPTDYQMEILEALVTYRRVCVRACRGGGKSTLASWTLLWFVLTRESLGMDYKVITTASAWSQVRKFLWPEIHKWTRKLNWKLIGRDEFKPKDELYTTSLRLSYGQATAVVSDRSDLVEGAHADQMLYIFDESKAIPDAMWNSVEGAMTSQESYWLAISTPAKPEGRFYDIHARREGLDEWWTRHITLQEAVDAGRISPEWANRRLEQWGENSINYRNHVLGEFAQEQTDTLILFEWVEEAIKRWYKWKREFPNTKGPDQVGADIARKGGDRTVIAKRYGKAIDTLEKYGKIDLMESAGLLVPYLKKGDVVVYIDIVGLGAGVYDRLGEQFPDQKDIQLQAFHPQEKTDFVDRTEQFEFIDAYSAAWWNMRELLNPENGEDFCLPPDDHLMGELISPGWSMLSSGKIKVEPKEKVKERLGRSPDSADAVVLACWQPIIWEFAFG